MLTQHTDAAQGDAHGGGGVESSLRLLSWVRIPLTDQGSARHVEPVFLGLPDIAYRGPFVHAKMRRSDRRALDAVGVMCNAILGDSVAGGASHLPPATLMVTSPLHDYL